MLVAGAIVLAAVGIIVALVYVGHQIRESTRQRSLDAYHAVLGEIDDMSKIIADDHGSADIWWRASKGLSMLTDTERVRYFAMLYMMFRSWEKVFHYQKIGELEDWNADVVSKPMVDFVMSDGVQEYWALRKRWYTPDFREWVDNRIKERSGVDIYDEEQFRIFGTADPRKD